MEPIAGHQYAPVFDRQPALPEQQMGRHVRLNLQVGQGVQRWRAYHDLEREDEKAG
jgi:hypothetical protein